MLTPTEKIWHNGKFINWDDATLHVMSHVVHYGSSVFEGVRCYALPGGPAIFRATEHMQRLIDSARIYRIEIPFTRDEILRGMIELVGRNGVWPCYIRPVVLRGYGEAGVNPFKSPTEVYICNYPWGKYLGSDASEGVDVCISSWTRIAPNTLPAMAKSGANYMNSQLIKMEAVVNGYAEGIALDDDVHHTDRRQVALGGGVDRCRTESRSCRNDLGAGRCRRPGRSGDLGRHRFRRVRIEHQDLHAGCRISSPS